MLIAVGPGAVAVALLSLPVETIGTRFSGIPRSLPIPALPASGIDKAISVLPDAGAFTLQGLLRAGAVVS